MKPDDDPRVPKIIAALENSQFKWRTISGIAAETKLPAGDVLEVLAKLSDAGMVLRSKEPAENGADLYTTRKHFKSFVPITQRLMAAFRNRSE